MNEYARAWVDRLRKNDLPQSKQGLRVDGGYCCLAVGNEISELGEWSDIPIKDDSFGLSDTYIVDDQSESALMHPEVQELLGMLSQSGRIHVDDGDKQKYLKAMDWADGDERTSETSLAKINDYTDATFPEIADLIEKYQFQLFA
jgi:hypothetical protein